MTVSAKFGTCSDAINVITKSPTLGAAVNCTVKDAVAVSNPYLIVSADKVSRTDNYCQISDYGRYYWIVSVTDLPGGRRGVQCEVDPLYSFAADIKNLDVYVARNENTKQSYMYDTEMPTESQMYVDYKKFSGSDLPAKATNASAMRYLMIIK